jgi:ABC-type transport system involved in multi-copper enzyme maturation permease subunit
MTRKVGAIAASVFSDALRRKVPWVVVVFGALMAVMIPSLPSYGAGVVDAVFREVSIALVFVAALVVTLALAVTRVPSEVERRTVFNILARDVARWEYLLGVWLGILAVMAGVLLALFAITVAIGWYTYGTASIRLLQAALALWFEMGVVAAACLVLTARWGPVTASVGALAFVFIGHSAPYLYTRGAENVTAPWWLPSLDVFNVINPVAHGTGISLAYAGAMFAAFAIWSALLLVVAAAAFQPRDL